MSVHMYGASDCTSSHFIPIISNESCIQLLSQTCDQKLYLNDLVMVIVFSNFTDFRLFKRFIVIGANRETFQCWSIFSTLTFSASTSCRVPRLSSAYTHAAITVRQTKVLRCPILYLLHYSPTPPGHY